MRPVPFPSVIDVCLIDIAPSSHDSSSSDRRETTVPRHPVSNVCPQPEVASQRSTVHPLPSSQETLPAPTQRPALQWSPTVHPFPSEQGSVSSGTEQRPST